MEIKRSDIFGLDAAFGLLMKVKLDPEVAYKIAYNAIVSNGIVERIRKSYKSVDGFDEVEQLRSDIIINGGGQRQANGSFSIPADNADAISKAVEAFNDQHRDVIDAQDAYNKEFDELLGHCTHVAFEIIDRKELTAAIEPEKLVLMIKTGILTDGSK